MLVLSISPSLPLFPEPMVKMWPSSSLQAPTSDAFLGTVALAPLPRPPRPRPPRPVVPPRPPRPAFVSRPMSSGILGFSFRGISTILFSCSSKNFSYERTFLSNVFLRTNVSLARILTNERFSRSFLRPRTLSLPPKTTGSTFLATDGLSTFSEMVRRYPTNFYYDSLSPVASYDEIVL